MTATLQVDRLTTGYLRAPVLRDVSLQVGDEIVALFGANGAGKTTLLRTLSGNLKPWSGSIAIGGRDTRRLRPWRCARLGLAHVPEGRHVFTAMTVSDNLDVAGLVARDASGRRDEVYELFPRLHERRRQLAGSLSGGEQQMLAIGRALMTEPRLLCIDEMSAGLAPVIVQRLVEGLLTIRARGISVLLVEQSPQFVADVVDRVYVLERGSIVTAGTMRDLGGVEALAEVYLGLHTTRHGARQWTS